MCSPTSCVTGVDDMGPKSLDERSIQRWQVVVEKTRERDFTSPARGRMAGCKGAKAMLGWASQQVVIGGSGGQWGGDGQIARSQRGRGNSKKDREPQLDADDQ